MSGKTFIPEGEQPPASQIGASLEALVKTIHDRRSAGEGSYTYRLLTGASDGVLKKVMEEAGEVALAAKDADGLGTTCMQGASSHGETSDSAPQALDEAIDHLRYEAADVVYHLMVVLERYGIGIDEFAAELNSRMTEQERPIGGVRIVEGHVNRNK